MAVMTTKRRTGRTTLLGVAPAAHDGQEPAHLHCRRGGRWKATSPKAVSSVWKAFSPVMVCCSTSTYFGVPAASPRLTPGLSHAQPETRWKRTASRTWSHCWGLNPLTWMHWECGRVTSGSCCGPSVRYGDATRLCGCTPRDTRLVDAQIDMTPRGDGYGGALVPAGAGAGAGASGHGRPPRSSKDHRNSLAAKLKLDLGGAQPTRTTAVRRASALSGAGSRRKSVYSDDRGAASHRSGRMHNAGDVGSNDGDTIDADDIEMNLETIFEGCVAWPRLCCLHVIHWFPCSACSDGITFPQEGQVVRCHYKAFVRAWVCSAWLRSAWLTRYRVPSLMTAANSKAAASVAVRSNSSLAWARS